MDSSSNEFKKWVTFKESNRIKDAISWYFSISVVCIIASLVAGLVMKIFHVSTGTLEIVMSIIAFPVLPPALLIEFLMVWDYSFVLFDIISILLILFSIVFFIARIFFMGSWRILLKPWCLITSCCCIVFFYWITSIRFFSDLFFPIQDFMDSPFSLLEFIGIPLNETILKIRTAIFDLGPFFTWLIMEAIGIFIFPFIIARKGRYQRIQGGKIYDLVQEMYKKGNPEKRVLPKKVKLYYAPDEDLNACAFGFNRIAITNGLISYMDRGEKQGEGNVMEEMYQGIIAHELGHIIHMDVLGSAISNVNVGIIVFVISIPYMIFSFFTRDDNNEQSVTGCLVGLFLFVFIAIGAVFNLLIHFSEYVAYILGGRKDEYKADRFAVDIGYGKGISHYFIQFLEDSDGGFSDPHPSSVKRLLRVFSRMDSSKYADDTEYSRIKRFAVYTANDILQHNSDISIKVQHELKDLILKIAPQLTSNQI